MGMVIPTCDGMCVIYCVFLYVCVEHEGGASEEGPSTAVVKGGGGGSESDEEYEVESRGSDQEGYSSVEEGEPHCILHLVLTR